MQCQNLREVSISPLGVSLAPQVKHPHSSHLHMLQPLEHIPGWLLTNRFWQLSFLRDGLSTKSIFYHGWTYDVTKRRATYYVDEFGEVMFQGNSRLEDQVNFEDDLHAALAFVGKPNMPVFTLRLK
jgi:hypothetical protein